MDKKYRVLFLEPLSDKPSFMANMGRMGVSPSLVDEMMTKAPVVMKKDMTLGEARRYADAVNDAGGRVSIQEDGCFESTKAANDGPRIEPFENFTRCPECGQKQKKSETCIKCGTRLDREG